MKVDKAWTAAMEPIDVHLRGMDGYPMLSRGLDKPIEGKVHERQHPSYAGHWSVDIWASAIGQIPCFLMAVIKINP